MKRRDSILIHTDDPGRGGAAQYNDALARGLVAAGFKVAIAQGRLPSPAVAEREVLGITHHWLDYDTNAQFARTVNGLADALPILRAAAPDLLLMSNCSPVSNFAAKRVAISLGIPFITTENFVGAYLADSFKQLLDELARHFQYARQVIAVSEENLGLLRSAFRLPADKGTIIHYGRPESFFAPRDAATRDRLRAELRIPDDGVLFFTAARLDPVKGFAYQLEAILAIRQQHPAWARMHFAWAGDGPLREPLAAKLRELKLTDRVHLLGPRDDVAQWLDAADVFVLPSQVEGMPLSIMEAMAKGLPVIATAVSGIPEELADTGRVIPSPAAGNAMLQQLAAAMVELATDAPLRARLGTAAAARAATMFRVPRMVDQTISVIDRALLPARDYVAPALAVIRPDAAFPNLMAGDARLNAWQYLRRDIPHNWYHDARNFGIGFASRDEASILYNAARSMAGKPALEIGCWLGWSAAHLALGGVASLDVVDPVLAQPEVRTSVEKSLADAGVTDRVRLHAAPSPSAVADLAAKGGRWNLVFIDGNHDRPGPLQDAKVVEQFAADDAMVLFHDLVSPDVAEGLDWFRQRGWKTRIFQTMQIMGVAWRGNAVPPAHVPDARVTWPLPAHLAGYEISGAPSPAPVTTTAGPLVSICIPLFNKASAIERVLRSCLAQTHGNIQIVISDNASTDGSADIAAKIAAADPRVILRRLDSTISVHENWRYALRLGTGEYLKLQSADDEMDPRFVQQMLAAIQSAGSEFAICRNRPRVDPGGTAVADASTTQYFAQVAAFLKDLLATSDAGARARKLLERSVVDNLLGDLYSAIFHRNCLPRSWDRTKSGFADTVAFPDWDFLIRLVLDHRGTFVDEPLSQFNYNASSPTVLAQKSPAAKVGWDVFSMMMPLTVLTDPTLSALRAVLRPGESDAVRNVVIQRLQRLQSLIADIDNSKTP